MGKYTIIGKTQLNGTIEINGGKNAALPILAASVLNGDINVISNCPRISDTITAIEILKSIGCTADFENKTVIIDSSFANKTEIPFDLVKKMRSSIIFMGAMLSRFKEVTISYPGGCELGKRPIDLHLKALKKMGASINEENGLIHCKCGSLKGAEIHLSCKSVGATQNIMLAAVKADGITIIKNAAREPEIIDLEIFLKKMGAKVSGAGTDTVIIEGVKTLLPVNHSIIPDRIEAGTYLAAAAASGGTITLKNVFPPHLYPITETLAEAGCIITQTDSSMTLYSPERLNAVPFIKTLPHPGFPTDMQPQLTALMTIAKGKSGIEETIFESRTGHIPELIKMGADIKLKNNRKFIIHGVKSLKSADITAKDLRGGAALIIAALSADGESSIYNSCHVERGYENIVNKLCSIGARINLTE